MPSTHFSVSESFSLADLGVLVRAHAQIFCLSFFALIVSCSELPLRLSHGFLALQPLQAGGAAGSCKHTKSFAAPSTLRFDLMTGHTRHDSSKCSSLLEVGSSVPGFVNPISSIVGSGGYPNVQPAVACPSGQPEHMNRISSVASILSSSSHALLS